MEVHGTWKTTETASNVRRNHPGTHSSSTRIRPRLSPQKFRGLRHVASPRHPLKSTLMNQHPQSMTAGTPSDDVSSSLVQVVPSLLHVLTRTIHQGSNAKLRSLDGDRNTKEGPKVPNQLLADVLDDQDGQGEFHANPEIPLHLINMHKILRKMHSKAPGRASWQQRADASRRCSSS